MRPDEILNRLRAANPASLSEIQAGTTADVRASARARAIRLAESDSGARPRGRRDFTAPRVVAAALAAAAVIGVILVGGGSPTTPAHPEFAAAAVRVAEANQRLLVTAPGWSVTRADEFGPTDGEIGFSDGEHELQITWYGADSYGSYLRDREYVDDSNTEISLLGQSARLFQYGNSTDYATMLPPQGKTFSEIRGDLGSKNEYLGVLRSLRSADVETWLLAMPANVVQPTDRAATVDAMLEGIPIPPGLDLERVRSEDAVLDRYHLGAEVTGTVACAWFDRWFTARESGDAAAEAAAVEAMRTAPDWAILQEMASEGAWSQVLWGYSRQMAAGRLDHGYVSGLGCRDR